MSTAVDAPPPARPVFFNGTTPNGLHHEVLGWYDPRSAAPLVNGRASYLQRGSTSTGLWYADTHSWMIGELQHLGESVGSLAAHDTAASPDAVTTMWQTAPAWKPAQLVKCLVGANAVAAAEQSQQQVERGARSIFLGTGTLNARPTPEYTRLLGWYDRVRNIPLPAATKGLSAGGTLLNGRSVYTMRGNANMT